MVRNQVEAPVDEVRPPAVHARLQGLGLHVGGRELLVLEFLCVLPRKILDWAPRLLVVVILQEYPAYLSIRGIEVNPKLFVEVWVHQENVVSHKGRLKCRESRATCFGFHALSNLLHVLLLGELG